MKPPAFDYIVATDCDTAVTALARAGGEAKILAGGQSLMPMLNFRLLRPSILVDINRIPGLDFIDETPDSLRIGALTRHFQLETSPLIAQHFPVLSCAVAHVGHLAIRNRGRWRLDCWLLLDGFEVSDEAAGVRLYRRN